MRSKEWYQIPDERIAEFNELRSDMSPKITKEDIVKPRRSQRIRKKIMMVS